MTARFALLRLVLAAGIVPAVISPARADPCADGVTAFVAGQNGGLNSDLLPGIVTGPPYGAGQFSGSLDTVSLGNGGSITLSFEDNAIVDAPGVDFTVFENAFVQNQAVGAVFAEAGVVSASADGVQFIPFPYTTSPLGGLAGLSPVHSNPANGIDPRDPAVSGGDAFDLATIGLSEARFVRITDPGTSIPDPGNVLPVPGVGKSGFDLDAVVAVHSRETCATCCDLNGDGELRANDLVFLLREVLGPPSGRELCGPSPCRATHCGDANRSAELDPGDVVLCLKTILDGRRRCAAGACDLGS